MIPKKRDFPGQKGQNTPQKGHLGVNSGQKGQNYGQKGHFYRIFISDNPDKNKKANSQNGFFRDSATMGFFTFNTCRRAQTLARFSNSLHSTLQ